MQNYDRNSQILVVDDDDTLLKFFKIHLNKFFSRVSVVPSAKEAVEVLKSKEIDLMLTDVRMPRIDGLALLKKVRRRDPTIPVLFISGASLTPEVEEECQRSGEGYLRKPFSVDQLQSYLSAGIQRRQDLARLAECLGDRRRFVTLVRDGGEPNEAEQADEEVAALITTARSKVTP